ncbi:hypothetical protein PIB30_002631 [Stylosanthes scabra]|uniref:RRM domain-containing protein n=1 Tax=Stylosanthes scabra TaxID=79078 RepID=A0ABU6Q2V1_9FABA|nr:hypothetical protein [Stylosanthes scabra]
MLIRLHMETLFEGSVSVVDVYISRKFRKNNSTNFAFVRFQYKNHALRAIQSLNGNKIDGGIISVSEAKYGRCNKQENFDKMKHNYDSLSEKQQQSSHVRLRVRSSGVSFKGALMGVHKATDNTFHNKNSMTQTAVKGDNNKVELEVQKNDIETEDRSLEHMVQGVIDQRMWEKMTRSLVGESVIPLKRDIIPSLFDDWHTLV